MLSGGSAADVNLQIQQLADGVNIGAIEPLQNPVAGFGWAAAVLSSAVSRAHAPDYRGIRPPRPVAA
jgi:hypothetical protein